MPCCLALLASPVPVSKETENRKWALVSHSRTVVQAGCGLQRCTSCALLVWGEDSSERGPALSGRCPTLSPLTGSCPSWV